MSLNNSGNRVVIITGLSQGIGQSIAKDFATSGFNVLVNSSDEQELKKIVSDLSNLVDNNNHISYLVGDISEKGFADTLIEEAIKKWGRIDVLINNAGLALGRDLFQDADLSDWNTMIDTNLKGLLYVSKAVVPFMMKRKKGHIINLGSTAAKDPYQGGNVYCASKAAVDSVSKCMRMDLLSYHIKVTAIHPGAAETEFALVRFKGEETTAKKVYEGFHPLSAEDVADIIFYTASLPEHVCINDLVITCTQQANNHLFDKSGYL